MQYAQALTQLQNDPIWETLGDFPGGPKECKDKTVYTSSSLTGITDCPWKYYLKYTLNTKPTTRSLPRIRGSAIHKTIHHLTSLQLAGKPSPYSNWGDILSQYFSDELQDPYIKDLPWSAKSVTDDTVEKTKLDAQSIVQNYLEREACAPIIWTEVPWRAIIRNPKTGTCYRASGTIDQLRGINNTNFKDGIRILDLKTDEMAPTMPYLSRMPQFSNYAFAALEGVFIDPQGEPVRIAQIPERLIWYHAHNLLPYKRAGRRSDGTTYISGDLRGEPYFDTTRSAAAIANWQAEACKIIQLTRMGIIFHAVNKFSCNICEMSHRCNLDAMSPEDACFQK